MKSNSIDVYGYEVYYICPECGSEAEVDTSIVLTSMPPMYNYVCHVCGRHGYCYTSECYTKMYMKDENTKEAE